MVFKRGIFKHEFQTRLKQGFAFFKKLLTYYILDTFVKLCNLSANHILITA
jgi:hypothetical protein